MGLESEMCNGENAGHMPQSKDGPEATKRVSHNIIEKKRKDRLKSAIHDIRKIIPLSVLSNKKATHCDVLEKAGEYIKSLEEENRRLLCSSNEDVRAEIIAKLRKEREDLAQEKLHLMDIIELSGMHSNANQTVLTADWRRRSLITVNNSENSQLTNCNEAALSKNREVVSGDTVVQKTAVGEEENLTELNPSLVNCGRSNNQKSIGACGEGFAMPCTNLSLTEESLVSSCDKSAPEWNRPAAADPKHFDLGLNNEDHVAIAVLPVGVTSKSGKPKKPKRTINLYLAERKDLQTPGLTMNQSNPFPRTNKFLDNSAIKSLVSCQEIANSSLCTTGTVNHSTPVFAVVFKSCNSQPDGSASVQTELKSEDHVTTICTAIDSVVPDFLTKTSEKMLPCNDTVINQNSFTAKFNSNFEENVDIIECCTESGVQLPSSEACHSDTLLNKQQFENDLITRTDTQVATTVTYAEIETEAALSASNESRIEAVTADKNSSNVSLGICCHCKKFKVVVNKYDSELRNGLRKCKSSEDLGKNYLERDNIVNPHNSKIQRNWTNERKSTLILLDKNESDLDERHVHSQRHSSDLLDDCQSNKKDSCRDSDKQTVEKEAANEMGSRSWLNFGNSSRDLRDTELLSESINNCQHSEHIHKDVLLFKEHSSVTENEQPHVLRSNYISMMDNNQPVMLQIQLMKCSADISVSRVTSGLEMSATMQTEKDPADDVPCSVVENLSTSSSPELTVAASQSPQSSHMRLFDDRMMGLFSSSSSLWSGTGNESQSRLSICHNGHVFVTSDTGQNWLPARAGSITSIPNNTLVPLSNASTIAFQTQSLHNASSSMQLIGSLNPIVLPTINQPLTIFLPSSQIIPVVSQPQVITPSVIVPYHQLYGATVQVTSISSAPQFDTVPSIDVTQNFHDTGVVEADRLSNCVTSYLTSETNENNSESVRFLHSSSESSLPCDLPTSSGSSSTINAVNTSSNCMEATSVLSVSQGILQEVHSLHSSEDPLDSGKKILKRKLSICTEPQVMNACRRPRLNSSSEISEKQILHLNVQTESSQVQSPKHLEPCAESNSLSEDLAGEESSSNGIRKPISSINFAYLPIPIDTRELCSSVSMTQSSPSDICLNSSVSNLNEDGEQDKNLLVSDLQSSGLIGNTDKCVARHSVDHAASDSDSLALLHNKLPEISGNKEPIESFQFVESALMKPSPWLLDFESRGKLPPTKLTADDNFISQFTSLKSSGWPALTSKYQDSQILHDNPSSNGQSSATVEESPSYCASSRRESEHTTLISHAVQCSDLQRDEICGFFEPAVSEHVEKACGLGSTSEESSVNQAMSNGRSKGSIAVHMSSPSQKDQLNQSTLLSQEHWLSDVAYRNSMPRPYELDSINMDKHIWAPAVDVDKIDQLNLTVSTTNQISGQVGIKRPSKTSKSHKKKLISKVCTDSEVSRRSIESVSISNQENNAMFSYNALISSQRKEFTFQSCRPPPLPPLSHQKSGEGILQAADKPTNYREVYESLKSRQPENSSILVMPPTEVNAMIAHNDGNIEKQNVELFNEDSSNVLSDALNFADNDDLPQIYLDEMDTIMDTQSTHGKPANQTKSTVAAWHQDLFGSSKRSKLRDKTDLDGNRHMDLDDRFPIHHRQDLLGFSADVFAENDDSSAVGSFSNVLLNRKANVLSNSSWQLPVFSESLNTPEKMSYLSTNEHAFTFGTSKPYAGNNLYSATDGSSFHLDSAQVACTSSSRPKNTSSGGIFCLAQHAVQEKSGTAKNQLNSQNYDFSYGLKEFPGTCHVESSRRNSEQTFGLRNRNLPDYNLPFYNSEFSLDKSYNNIVNNVRCPPQSSLWTSYSNKDETKPAYSSTSSAVVSSATHLSFRPQVEVEYSNESHRTKVSMVQITSGLLSHSHGSNEKDGGPFAALSTPVQSTDGFAYTGGSSWNDHVREQSFLSESPWKSSYCASSSLRLGTTDIAHGNSPRNAFPTTTTLSGGAEPSGRVCDQFHFSISLPPSTVHGAALPSSTALPPFSLACLPLEHSSSFSFNLTAVPEMNSVDVAANQCSQEKRNQFSFYPLEHIEDDLPHVVPSARITSPPPCSQVTVSNFTFNGCELSPKNISMRRNRTESLQHHGKSRISPDNQRRPLPSFFNIASYGMKEKILAPVCSEAYPHSMDLGSSSTLVSNSAAVTHAMSFSPTSITNSCSLNAYHPQNFYHHGSTFPGSLTSPPLHHPPLAPDHRLSSEPQTKFDSSFSIHGLQFPPVLNFVPPPPPPPHLHPPTFDSPMVRFSSQIIGDPATACVSENSRGKVSHISESISSTVPSSLLPHDQHAKQPTPTETRSSKSSSKRSSRSSKKLSLRQTLHNDAVNPYFTLPNFSSGKNRSGIPTYFSSNPFRSEQGSCTTSSFNPLITGSQASLNLCQPPSGFVNISTSTQVPNTTSIPVLPPIHNFGFGNLFSDLNNPTALRGDGMSISPARFPQGVPPPPPCVLPKQSTFDPSPLHHQPLSKMPPIFLDHTAASSPPSTLHSMSINSLLGHQRPRFDDFRNIASTTAIASASGGVSCGVNTPFGLYRP